MPHLRHSTIYIKRQFFKLRNLALCAFIFWEAVWHCWKPGRSMSFLPPNTAIRSLLLPNCGGSHYVRSRCLKDCWLSAEPITYLNKNRLNIIANINRHNESKFSKYKSPQVKYKSHRSPQCCGFIRLIFWGYKLSKFVNTFKTKNQDVIYRRKRLSE